ncbi:HdeD family acid-resistance protein [Anaerorhabdus sp.]|jgi:uncharacterized membrane protein HdeD (DUF308 family)|uniref:HdeD family acid-resistance protein n=1 Tax=Anaerorhabdus sp. TaxID=1872524 RepID=UPI002FCA87C0
MERTQGKLIRQYIGIGSLAFTAVLYIVSGVAFLVWKSEIPQIVKFVIFGYSMVMGITGILGCFSNFSFSKLLRGAMPIAFGFIFLAFINQFSTLYALFLGIYILIIAIVKTIDYSIKCSNKTPGRIMELLSAIVIYLFALPLLFAPGINIRRAFLITGLFCIFYGLSLLGDFIVEIAPIKQTNRFKKRVRVNLPVFMTMLMPKKAISYVNKLLAVDEDGIIEEDSFKVDTTPGIEIFVHVTEKGFGTIGHADIWFEGSIYCYGNYDFQSSKLFGTIGDGVLFTTNDRDEYIKFCAKETGDSIFAFGLNINESQKEAIRKRLNELFTHIYPWESLYQKMEQGEIKLDEVPTDYASNLYKATHAKMYKFKDTSFKTYFVLTTNCVKLSDYVIRATGIAAANPNGIMSPGAYYDYFNQQYRLKNSIVISKQTYHHNATIEHEKAL